MKSRPKALVIGNEPAMRRLVRVTLSKQNYRVLEACDGSAGSRMVSEHNPDVILLDLELPDMSGIAWLRTFREQSQTPVIVLSEFADEENKVCALDAGANDYLLRPFDGAEMLARLRVLQRSLPGIAEEPLLEKGDLKVNRRSHETTIDGFRLEFTLAEEAVFYLLVQHAGKVVTNAQLLRTVWGNDAAKRLHELQVLVARIRSKLEAQGNRVMIRTASRLGYQLVVAGESECMHVPVSECEFRN